MECVKGTLSQSGPLCLRMMRSILRVFPKTVQPGPGKCTIHGAWHEKSSRAIQHSCRLCIYFPWLSSGTVKRKAAPSSVSRSLIVSPCIFMIRSQMLSPRPVPFPEVWARSEVKKRS